MELGHRHWAEKDEVVADLERLGFAVVVGVVPDDLCDEAEDYSARSRQEAEDLVASGSLDDTYVFGNVKERARRVDLKMTLAAPVVRQVLEVTLYKLGSVISEFVTDEGRLCELGSLHSLPGSVAQPAHADTHGSNRCCLTAFTALVDVHPERGPTEVWPGSHIRPSNMSAEDVLSSRGPGLQCLLPKGATLLMDSRLIHRGGANSTQATERLLFYTSWLLPGASVEGSFFGGWRLPGSTHSILAEYGHRFKLADWHKWATSVTPPTTAWDLYVPPPSPRQGLGGDE